MRTAYLAAALLCLPGTASAANWTLQLSGGALARLESLVPAGHRPVVHLTLTDDHPWAQAFVIIEALPL